MPLFAALALTAALVHSLNHSFFKSLLFLATGSVLHATNHRSLGKLGGLIRSMPWVAGFALVGTLSIAGLPPFNGFVSEWLLLQSFLFTPQLPHAFLNMLIPLGAAALALTVALAAYVMVKFYGVIFLGQPREGTLENTHDANWLETTRPRLAGIRVHSDWRTATTRVEGSGTSHRKTVGRNRPAQPECLVDLLQLLANRLPIAA